MIISSFRWKALSAFVAGCLLVFSFAPFNLYFLASLLPAWLFYLVFQAETRKQQVLLSWLFGIGMFAGGTHWIYFSVHFFGGAHWALAVVMTALFVVLMSLFLIPFGLLVSFAKKHSAWLRLLIVIPAAWVLAEWVRSWFLTGFPWLLLGQSQVDTMLSSIAPVTGVFGVSWLNALLAGLLVLFFLQIRRKERIASVSLVALILFFSYGMSFIQWTTPVGEAIKVSLLQGNIPQEKKWEPAYFWPTLRLYEDLTKQNWDSDVIIWPETAIPGFFDRKGKGFLETLYTDAMMNKTDLVIGGFSSHPETHQAYNSIIALRSDGSSDIYAKQHRVPFSEYIPFLDYLRWLEQWIRLPYDSIGKGEGKTTLNVAGQVAQMSVCYEDVYGNKNLQGLPEASLLINLSNDGWFTGSIEPMQHMEIARMRALETGRYLLRSTNTGVSGIIDNKGRIISTADPYTTTAIQGVAQPYSGSTPYIFWGNWFIILIISGFYLIGGFFYKKN